MEYNGVCVCAGGKQATEIVTVCENGALVIVI